VSKKGGLLGGAAKGGQTLFMNEHFALRRQRVTHLSFGIVEIYYAIRMTNLGNIL